MTLSRPRLSPFRFFSLAALVLGGCLSDGPNETGIGFLQHQGIQLSTPLYHFTFQNLPVDSVFSTEFPQNNFGDSLLVVGQSGPFRAAVRMGFQITTQAQRDSILVGLNLKLVSLPPLPGGDSLIGYGYLQSSTASHDSLSLLIEAFAWNDTNGQFADSLPVYHSRILASFTNPFSTLNPVFEVRDTARIALAAAYRSGIRDSIQICALKNLRNQMIQDTLHNWIVFLEVSPLAGSKDSGMFRFVGNAGTSYDPGLLMGTYQKGGADTLPTLLIPYTSAGEAGVNYQVTHTDAGPPNTLLYGVSRGLNFRLNRNVLLDSIQARMGSKYPAAAIASGKYSTAFFVPFAQVYLPLVDGSGNPDPRTTVDPGPLALDMQLISDVDSLDPQSDSGLIPLALNDSMKLYPMQPAPPAYAGQTVDTLICIYRQLPADTTLRQMILHWQINSTITDTFLFTPDGNRQELTLARYPGWLKPATLGVYPEESEAMMEVYFNVGSGVEPDGFTNPSTGQPQTLYSALSPRFYRPGATSLEVRATNSITALLNRVSGTLPVMQLKPNDHNAFDTAYYDTSSYNFVSYPVMGEIGFPLQSGITVDLYLYPLASP